MVTPEDYVSQILDILISFKQRLGLSFFFHSLSFWFFGWFFFEIVSVWVCAVTHELEGNVYHTVTKACKQTTRTFNCLTGLQKNFA